jgi:uncharacterized protein YbaP (TraB family)
MVNDRNIAWIPVMRPVMRHYLDEGNAVVVVGAAHLPGQSGLIHLLEKSGYAVERISLPADH